MPLRDVLLTLVVFGLLPVCFARPWVGVLVWSWFAYMNPHRLTWGFAYNMPFSLMIALATLSGFVLTRDRKPFVWSPQTLSLFMLWGWFTVTTALALYPAEAWGQWNRVSKILLMALLTVPLFQDRRRLRLLLFVIAGSLGFYALKAARFVVFTGGEHMVLGAPGATFISTNNALALALNMSLPILVYLAREESRRWLRTGLWSLSGATVVAVPFTYSRGGVLGLAVVLALLFLRSRAKLILIPAALVGLLVFTQVVPERWGLRMQTIWHYEEDQSAMSRLAAWAVGLAIAEDRPIFGGGFWVFNRPETWARYAPVELRFPLEYADAHSIYFNMLGEHGYVGLGLFGLWVVFTLATLWRLRRLGRAVPGLAWIGNYAHMLQTSIVAYLVTGAFLSVAYFDLAYHLFIIAAVLRHLAEREQKALDPVPVRGSAPLRWSVVTGAAS
jgi:probable O-glycosylation ligase (exosortase A-associated)